MKSNILDIFVKPTTQSSESEHTPESPGNGQPQQPAKNTLFESKPVEPCLFCESTASLFEIVGGLVLVSGVLFRKQSVVRGAKTVLAKSTAPTGEGAGADLKWQKWVKQAGAFVVGLGVYNGFSTFNKAMNGEYKK